MVNQALSFLLISMLSLTACDQPQNPLLTDKPLHAAHTLYQAEQAAMVHLKVPFLLGHVYFACVDDMATINEVNEDDHFCQGIFQSMQTFMQKMPHYRHITLSQLCDKTMLPKLKQPLASLLFTEGDLIKAQIKLKASQGGSHGHV